MKSKSLIIALGAKPKDDEDEDDEGDLELSAASAILKAIEAKDKKKLSEALSIHYEACMSKADEDDDSEED